jgi:hypothetical protein
MSTQASRELYIEKALAAYKDAAVRETYRVPFRDGMVMEVVEVPLDFPVLNTESSRIAPLLADHPEADIVASDPDGEEAQRVVTGLVLASHRKLEGLRESLAHSQNQPGVITRSGKLINANTRCVVLRELASEGKVPSDRRLRVAVLPADFTAPEETQLENVLQKQVEHKDEYNFVGELMLLRKLAESGLSDAAIARQQDLGKRGPALVRDLREILDLMEHARRFIDPPIKFEEFVKKEDQRENWIGILREVRKLRKEGNTAAADDRLRGFLIANFVDLGSVHKGGRLIDENWVAEDLVEALKQSDDSVAKALVEHIETKAKDAPDPVDVPDGAELFGDVATEPESPVTSAALDIVAAAAGAGAGEIPLLDGKEISGAYVLVAVKTAAKKTFDDAARKEEAGNRLERPVNLLNRALTYVRDARDALEEVVGESDFAPFREQVENLAEDLEIALDRVSELLPSDTDAP